MLKEFLKITKAKIIITLLIPLLFTIRPEVDFTNGLTYHFSFMPIPIVIYYVLLIFLAIVPTQKVLVEPIHTWNEELLHFIISIILPLAINYTISCLIMHFYRKYTKKQKKKIKK